MDDVLLLAAICKDRKAYEALTRIGYSTHDLTEIGRVVAEFAADQYQRDSDLQAVSLSLLRSAAERRYGKGSMADSVMDLTNQFPKDVSGINVVEEYRLLRLARTSSNLASLLASGQHGTETAEAIEQYRSLVDGESQDDAKDRLTYDDFMSSDGERIMLYPTTLSTFIGNGVHRGHNVTIFGRPNSGKSMLALNNAACLIKHGYKVLYVANEEPAQDITRRLLSRLACIKIDELDDPDRLREAFARAGKDYQQRWNLLHKSQLTYTDIRRAAARLRPDVIIVDQLKNIHVAEDNRALQLDRLARQVRELGIEFNAVTISVTQAGESAEGNSHLGMSDVEWSNTGIPGAADLMLGIGVNDELLAEGKRIISVCKNKVKPEHGTLRVWLDPTTTKVSGRAL